MKFPLLSSKGFFLSVFSVALITLPADAIVRRHDVADQNYIDFGAQFPSVAKLERSDGGIEGSGVLVDSQWILTAAHLSPTQAVVDGQLHVFAEFIRHPDWDGTVANGNDIALARLVTSVSGVGPSPWFTGTDQTGVVGVSVGFGRAGDGLTGEVIGTEGTKRAAESTIERVGSTPGPPFGFATPSSAFEYDFLAPGDSGVLPLEGMAVFYDSGGPVFLDVNGTWEVAGIHSYVSNSGGTLGTYGDRVGSTRVSLYDEWIMATIPEPSTWAMLVGLGSLGVAIAFRRRKKPTLL